jgi:DNA-binding transcriptional LysR family regulator
MRSSKRNNDKSKERWGIVDPPVISDWEAAHAFLEVTRSGSFRAAAQKLGQSVNALRRRIDAFEREMGGPLLIRHVNGVQPTEEGAKIYTAALQMESASFDLLAARQTSGRQIEGEVGLAITEGMGTAWLVPKLADFQRTYPKLIINLRCGQKPPDLLRLEADLSVQLQRPKEPDLKVVKLGRLHMMLFAAKPYLDAHGYPSNASDLAGHRFAAMADDKRQWEEDYKKYFPALSAELLVLRNNVSSAHFSAILTGAAMGALPTYVQSIGAGLVPLHLGIDYGYDIWLTYRADAKRTARIQQTIEWVMQIYDPRRYPWFRDEFIHPDRLADLYKGAPLSRAFVDTLTL